ncbi:MAG: hypothetical protein WC694_03735 [Candidatus Paceibacterota bacterium]
MQFEKNENKRPSLIKSVIEESKKLRAERGEDFFSEKKSVEENTETNIFQNTHQETSKIHSGSSKKAETDFRTLRDSHVKLAHLIVQYDSKKFEKNDQVLESKKKRSKSVHLYLDEKTESFLKAEAQKEQTVWGLRKNAGTGQLIQKFLANFSELKKREEKQLKHIKKIIDEFRVHLVEFKKNSSDPNDYQNAERSNQKMKALSSDLSILLSLLEFEDQPLQKGLGVELFQWVDFLLKWKIYS